jgi:hypothetical protein
MEIKIIIWNGKAYIFDKALNDYMPVKTLTISSIK